MNGNEILANALNKQRENRQAELKQDFNKMLDNIGKRNE